jgi:hypothetical protein
MATEPGKQPDGPDPASTARLEQAVDDIAGKLRQLQAGQRAMRLEMIITSLVALALLLGFSARTYLSVRENLRQDKVEQALQARVQEMLPDLRDRAVRSVVAAAPTYRDLAIRRFDAIRPELADRFVREAQKLPQDLERQITKDLELSFNRVSGRLEADLRKEFPKLRPEHLKSIGDHIQGELLVQGDDLSKYARGICEQEFARINGVLAKFEVPDVRAADKQELERQFLHDLLMLADYEFITPGAAGGLARTAAVPTH